ncbi:MAG: hypothetical protein JNL42_03930 [Anaerolineae bacterium]|nr:hypothetical protein [Anaerolineae bacterium]
MMKTLNQWSRKIHRWLALPFALMVIALLLARDTSVGMALQRVQPPIMLAMVLTGGYLFLLPYLSKMQRGRRTAANARQRTDAVTGRSELRSMREAEKTR